MVCVSDLCVLDLFSGAGGAAMGMIQAGVLPQNVIGVDWDKNCQKYYPGRFIHHDVFRVEEMLDWREIIDHVDLIWLSPKCEGNSVMTNIRGDQGIHEDQITRIRSKLAKWNKPYIIENVPGAAKKRLMRADITLNGYSIKPALMLDRPRVFELSFPASQPKYMKRKDVPPEKRQKYPVVGRLVSTLRKGGNERYLDMKRWWPIEMGIDFIPVNAQSSVDPSTGKTYCLFSLAIPPAFSKYLIEQFVEVARI